MRSLACGPPLGVASGACPWRGGWSGPLEGACLVCGRMWACLPPLPSGLGVQTAGYDTCTPQIPRQARMVPVQLHAYIIMGSKGMAVRGLGKPMPRMDSAGHCLAPSGPKAWAGRPAPWLALQGMGAAWPWPPAYPGAKPTPRYQFSCMPGTKGMQAWPCGGR